MEEQQEQTTFLVKKVQDTTNYYFTPQPEFTLWNAYIFNTFGKGITISYKKDENYLLYKMLKKKGDYLKHLISKTEPELLTESDKYFYIRVWVPPKQMYYLQKCKGHVLKEAHITISNIWESNNRFGFHTVLKKFSFKDL